MRAPSTTNRSARNEHTFQNRFSNVAVENKHDDMALISSISRNFAVNLVKGKSISTPVVFYHPNVLDHYENPRNVGSLDKNDQHVGTGLVGAPACGDVMKLQIKVDEALKLKNTDIAKELCLPPVKLHCSMLAEDAIKAALSDYRIKQKQSN
ncbi:hypothetical protein B566_EDAN009285 [Ephemera danica]|nr:hypothetical protein B566_EDAN009285 [Ephemera danica]